MSWAENMSSCLRLLFKRLLFSSLFLFSLFIYIYCTISLEENACPLAANIRLFYVLLISSLFLFLNFFFFTISLYWLYQIFSKKMSVVLPLFLVHLCLLDFLFIPLSWFLFFFTFSIFIFLFSLYNKMAVLLSLPLFL